MCFVLCQFAIQWKRYQDLLHLYKLNPGAYTKEVDDLTSFLAQVSVTCPILSWPQFWLRSVLSTVFCPTDHSVLPHWWPDLNADSGQCYPVFCPIDHSVLPHWCPDLLSDSGQCCPVFCPIDHNVLPHWWLDRIFGSGQFWPQYFAPLVWSIGGIPEVACLCLTLTLTSKAK